MQLPQTGDDLYIIQLLTLMRAFDLVKQFNSIAQPDISDYCKAPMRAQLGLNPADGYAVSAPGGRIVHVIRFTISQPPLCIDRRWSERMRCRREVCSMRVEAIQQLLSFDEKLPIGTFLSGQPNEILGAWAMVDSMRKFSRAKATTTDQHSTRESQRDI
jgi:hypothetical protein